MAVFTKQGSKLLRGWQRPGLFEQGIGAQLPEAYKKFWKEWRETEPTAVHYIPKEGKFERNDLTGEVHPIQNLPIPLKFPKEHNEGIWGGEGVIMGFQKRNPYKRRVPHFWVPVLKRSVIYSEVLDKYMSVTVTDRTIKLIHENFGFDHYLLKTLACDLKSILALSLKRKVLQALEEKCPAYADQPKLQEEVYNKYKKYLASYSREEIEWYGFTFVQACEKFKKQVKEEENPVPLKQLYRSQLIEKLKTAGVLDESGNIAEKKVEGTSWLKRFNPFSKET